MIDTANLQSRLGQAQAQAAAGRSAEAWNVLAPLRTAIDRNGAALRLYAVVAHQSGRIDEAIGALERIVAIENSPPDILGVLADTLDQAGRSAESAEHWTRLVRLQPNAADAHLNRSVTYSKAGNNEAALTAADEGLARFPGHARLLAARASALKNLKRFEEAIAAFDVAVAASPNRPRVRYNQAVALRAACRFDEACATFAEAEKAGASGSEFLGHWAAAELEAGRVDRAAELYRQAVALNSGNHEAMTGLTRLEIEYRGGSKAFDHYRDAAHRDRTGASWANWVHALAANKMNDLAAEVGREGIETVGRDPELVLLTAFAEGIEGDPVPALKEIEALPLDFDRHSLGLVSMAHLAVRSGDYASAAEFAERFQKQNDGNQIGWSLLSIAWRMLGDEREHWLCDYDRLVMVTDVPSPEGDLSPTEFAKVVESALDPLHQTQAAPGNQSLRNGTQTSGELFAWPDPVIARFREAVIAAAAKAVADLPDDPSHPFLSRKSTRFDFSGSWSVRLSGGGGHHVPHFHAHGWMSSAYYARLPKSGPAEREEQAGWIEFGRPPDMFNLDIGPRRVVEPKVGRLVLFPSFMLHGTRPFGKGKGDRLTAAFDYQPL